MSVPQAEQNIPSGASAAHGTVLGLPARSVVLILRVGDVHDGHQPLLGAEAALQPVTIHLGDDLQDVPFVEAQLSRLSGNVMAKSFHLAAGRGRGERVRSPQDAHATEAQGSPGGKKPLLPQQPDPCKLYPTMSPAPVGQPHATAHQGGLGHSPRAGRGRGDTSGGSARAGSGSGAASRHMLAPTVWATSWNTDLSRLSQLEGNLQEGEGSRSWWGRQPLMARSCLRGLDHAQHALQSPDCFLSKGPSILQTHRPPYSPLPYHHSVVQR